MHPDMAPAAYGVKQGEVTINCEKGRCASLRLQTAGTKFIILMSGKQLRAFMSSKGITMITPEAMQGFMKSMSRDVFTQYSAHNFVKKCTVRPGEALVLPFDWMFAEQVHNNADISGARCFFWLKTDMDHMTDVNKWLISSRKANNLLQNALDAIVSQECE